MDRDFSQSGERQTDFIPCVAWRGTGEFVSKYFRKGSMIVVSGRLQLRDWQDRDGNKRRSAEVVADSVYFGEAKRDDSRGSAYQAPPASNSAPPPAPQGQQQTFQDLPDDDGELPFD